MSTMIISNEILSIAQIRRVIVFMVLAVLLMVWISIS
jgi:hypothetical protein